MKEVINRLSSFVDSKQIFVEEENIDDIRRLIEYVFVLERKLKDVRNRN